MHGSFLGSKQQAIVTCTDLGEEDALLAHSADEFTLTVKDEYFAVHSENQHEACELRKHALSNHLLNVDPFLQFEDTLGHLPDFDRRFFHGEELDRIGEVDLGQLAVTIGSVNRDLLRCGIVERVRKSGLVYLVLKHLDSKAGSLEFKVVVGDQANCLSPIEVPNRDAITTTNI